jgi:hypothetical protein
MFISKRADVFKIAVGFASIAAVKRALAVAYAVAVGCVCVFDMTQRYAHNAHVQIFSGLFLKKTKAATFRDLCPGGPFRLLSNDATHGAPVRFAE